jgi:phosphopantothenoylcysteine synthetase/decarboxylase
MFQLSVIRSREEEAERRPVDGELADDVDGRRRADAEDDVDVYDAASDGDDAPV